MFRILNALQQKCKQEAFKWQIKSLNCYKYGEYGQEVFDI